MLGSGWKEGIRPLSPDLTGLEVDLLTLKYVNQFVKIMHDRICALEARISPGEAGIATSPLVAPKNLFPDLVGHFFPLDDVRIHTFTFFVQSIEPPTRVTNRNQKRKDLHRN